jgi:regulator of replication initiation timing
MAIASEEGICEYEPEADSEPESDDDQEVYSDLSKSELVNFLNKVMGHYAEKVKQLKILKGVYNSLNESAHKLYEENESLRTRLTFLEQKDAPAEKIDDEHENALQEFIQKSIKRSQLASMIYGVSRNNGQGIGYSHFSNCEKSKLSAQISKTPSNLYSSFVKKKTEDLNVSNAEEISESGTLSK